MLHDAGEVLPCHWRLVLERAALPPILLARPNADGGRHFGQATPAAEPKGCPMQDVQVVRREMYLPAPQAAVFALLTDPEKILSWMGTEAQVEPQPGGLYLVNVTGARCARGSFREVIPVHRLAYSFGWDGSEEVPPGSSLVEIDLIEQPDGTLLRLTHSGLPSAEQRERHTKGWAHYLDRLAEVVAGRDPGPDPMHGHTGRE